MVPGTEGHPSRKHETNAIWFDIEHDERVMFTIEVSGQYRLGSNNVTQEVSYTFLATVSDELNKAYREHVNNFNPLCAKFIDEMLKPYVIFNLKGKDRSQTVASEIGISSMEEVEDLVKIGFLKFVKPNVKIKYYIPGNVGPATLHHVTKVREIE